MSSPPAGGPDQDPSTFEEFFRSQNRRLRAYLGGCIYDSADTPRADLVDEVAQEAFLVTKRAWATIEPGQRARFLFGAARTILPQEAGRWRAERAWQRDAYSLLADLESEEGQEPAGEQPDAPDDPRRARCEDLIQTLPRRRREAVTHRLAGLTYKQIAEKMGLTEGAVKAHVSFAKRDLKRLLENSENSLGSITSGEEDA